MKQEHYERAMREIKWMRGTAYVLLAVVLFILAWRTDFIVAFMVLTAIVLNSALQKLAAAETEFRKKKARGLVLFVPKTPESVDRDKIH